MSELAKRLYGGIEYNQSPQERYYNDMAINDSWTIPSLVLGLYSGGTSIKGLLKEPIKKYGSELLLNYGKPIFKLFDNKLTSFGKVGKQYYKDNIQNTRDFSDVLNDYVYYPGSQIGKIRYKYLDQLPKLKENIKNSDFNRYIKNKYKRDDANGFDNLKINFKGKDYAYQIRNNAINGNKEFYNIKPFKYVEQDYLEQLFKDLLDNEY